MKKICLMIALCAMVAGCSPKEHKIAIAAHRGYWDCEAAGYAQNSIASLQQAHNQGLWGSEFDVRITADRELIVNHDPTVGGMSIIDTTLEALRQATLANGEHPSTVDEYLTAGAACEGTMLVYELKSYPDREDLENELTDLTIEALKRCNIYDPERVMFISFSLNICKRIADLCPGFTNQYLNGDLDPDAVLSEGINGIDYEYGVLCSHPEWVARAHELGMSVNVWTVNGREEIQKMIDLGVDCITTNAPLLARELLGERELK